MDLRNYVENFDEERERKINIIENGSDEEKLNFAEDLIKNNNTCCKKISQSKKRYPSFGNIESDVNHEYYRITNIIPKYLNRYIYEIIKIIEFYLENKKKLNEINSFSVDYDINEADYYIIIYLKLDKISNSKSAAHKN